MILLISIIITALSFLSGIFISYSTPLHTTVEKDLERKALDNAQLEGLQYASICLRADTLNPPPGIPSAKSYTTPLMATDGTPQREILVNINISGASNITVNATIRSPAP